MRLIGERDPMHNYGKRKENVSLAAAGEQVCHHRLFCGMRDPLEAALLKPLWVISPRKSNHKILFALPSHAA